MPPAMPSFASDPIYAHQKLIANRDLNEVLRTALQRQSQMFLQLGNPQLARSVFSANTFFTPANPKGKKGGPGQSPLNQLTPYEQAQVEATRQAGLEETGTSTLAKIAREHTLQQRQMNEQMNAANLFYSGARARGLGELARNRQFQETEAMFGAQTGLNQIMDMILGARRERRSRLASAAEAAYNRLLAEQLASA